MTVLAKTSPFFAVGGEADRPALKLRRGEEGLGAKMEGASYGRQLALELFRGGGLLLFFHAFGGARVFLHEAARDIFAAAGPECGEHLVVPEV